MPMVQEGRGLGLGAAEGADAGFFGSRGLGFRFSGIGVYIGDRVIGIMEKKMDTTI